MSSYETYEAVCAAPGCSATAVTSLNGIPFCRVHVPVTKPMRLIGSGPQDESSAAERREMARYA